MAGSMNSMPGGRRCRFQAEEEDLYGSEEEARIVYALKGDNAVATPLSDANAETVDSLGPTDDSPKEPGSGRSDTDSDSSGESEGK